MITEVLVWLSYILSLGGVWRVYVFIRLYLYDLKIEQLHRTLADINTAHRGQGRGQTESFIDAEVVERQREPRRLMAELIRKREAFYSRHSLFKK